MLLRELFDFTPEQMPSKSAWKKYVDNAPWNSRLVLSFWDMCGDVETLFERPEFKDARAAFVRAYKAHETSYARTPWGMVSALCHFLVGWYGLYTAELMHPIRPRMDRAQYLVAIQGMRFGRLGRIDVKKTIVAALNLPKRISRHATFEVPEKRWFGDNHNKFHSVGSIARRKKRPIDEDAPVSDAQRRLVELPELPTEIWEMIAERISDWRTLVAFVLTCRRFYRISKRTVKGPIAERTWLQNQRSRLAIAWSINDPIAEAALTRAFEKVRYQVNGLGWARQSVKTDEDRERVRRETNVCAGEFAMACHYIAMMWEYAPTREYDLHYIRRECKTFYLSVSSRLGAGYVGRGTFLLALAHLRYLIIFTDAMISGPSSYIRACMQPRIVQITGDSVAFAPHVDFSG